MDSDAAVIDKFGVRADQIVDLLALMGDAIDNVPGVEKCGPKTAAKWLAEYGSLDGVIANAAAIKGKIGDNLRAALPRLPLNRDAGHHQDRRGAGAGAATTWRCASATSRRCARCTRATASTRRCGAGRRRGDRARWRTASRACARGGRLRRGGRARVAAGARPRAVRAGRVRNGADRRRSLTGWIAKLQAADEFAFDTETDSARSAARQPGRPELQRRTRQGLLHPARARLSGRAGAAVARGGAGRAASAARAIRPRRKLGQHGKYDLHVLRRHGVDVRGYADDTMLESFVLNAGASAPRHGFAGQALSRLRDDQVRATSPARAPSRSRSRRWRIDDATRYAAEDADVTLRLHRVLRAEAAGRARAGARLPRDRDAAGAGAGADGGQRRAGRRRRAAPAVGRPGPAHAGRAAAGHRAGRPHLQPGFAQAAVRAAVRRAEAAGAGEDARAARRPPTRKRWRRSPTSTSCRG